jgi:signal transduction histidine kinase
LTGRIPSLTRATSKAARHNDRGLRPWLRDASLGSKLAFVLVIPLLAVAGLATARLVDSGRRAADAGLVRSLAVLSSDASALSHELHKERMAAADLLGGGADSKAFNLQVKRTDEAVAAYSTERGDVSGVPDLVNERLVRLDQQITTLGTLRQEVLDGKGVGAGEAALRYGVLIDELVSYQESVGQIAGDDDLAENIRAVAALSKTKSELSRAQSVAVVALQGGRVDDEDLSAFLSALTGQQEALLAFNLVASPQQRALVDDTVGGDALVLADQAETQIRRSANRTPLLDAPEANKALGAVVDLMRWVQQRLDDALVNRASDLRDSVLRQTIIESVAVFLILLLAISLALALARSLVRSLGRLREGALTVANRDLPETVARLSNPDALGEHTPEQIAAQVRDPIQLRGRDEIGQVAQAFNMVHREAVRVAAEQAALNTSVSAMFLNLARRSQSLVDRMIGQLDDIERNEEDPKRLARMFALDHLATRMRRNDENLLVLAGADSSPPRQEDALVVDVLRAAQSEVEQYARIEFGTVDTDVAVVSSGVNDVVRLVAELFDNATRFSPPNSAVVAEARRVGDHVIIQIEDRGLGMPAEQVSRLNARLAEPPAVDITAFRMMGLAVVGRLAARSRIRVELRCEPGVGTMAYVTLPTALLVLPRSRMRDTAPARPRPPVAELGSAPRQRALATRPGGDPLLAPASPGLGSALNGSGLGGFSGFDSQPASHSPNGTGLRDAFTPAAPPAPVAPFPPAAPASLPISGADLPVAGAPPSHLTSPAWHAAPAPTAPQQDFVVRPPMAPPTRPVAPADDTTELPIYREMEAVWFRSRGTQVDGPSGRPYVAPDALMTSVPVIPAPAPLAPTMPAQLPTDAPAALGSPGLPKRVPSARPESTEPAAAPAAYRPPAVPPAPAVIPAMPPVQVPAAAAAATGAPSGPGNAWRTAADDGWRAATAAAAPQVRTATRSGLPKRVPQAQLVPGGVATPDTPEPTRRSADDVRGLLSAYHRGVQRGRASSKEQ